MVFKNGNIGAVSDRFDHDPFQFGTRDVAGVKDAAFVVSALSAEVEVVRIIGMSEFAAGGELCSEGNYFPDRFGAGFNDGADGSFVSGEGPRPGCGDSVKTELMFCLGAVFVSGT